MFQIFIGPICQFYQKLYNQSNHTIQQMGGCQSTDQTQMPKFASLVVQNKFKKLQKNKLQIPLTIYQNLQPLTSNGKITDYICKVTGVQIQLSYLNVSTSNQLGLDKKYQDKQFLPRQQSIGKQKMPQAIQWLRPKDIFKEQYFVFEGKIQPLDIKQGRLGDCYFLSAIASISQYPFIIKRIFEATEVSVNGVYGIWLFVDGTWQCVVVDDFFPTHNSKPIFSKNHANQIWVLLLQKAYAKVYKSYQNIQSGLTGLALSNLTGAPYEYLCKNSSQKIDVDQAWTFLTQNIRQNHLICGSTQNNDRNQYLGLVSSHAYCVLDVQEVYTQTKKGKKKQRILKLLNPWGRYEWKGRWSEYSDVWSEELREQLQFEKTDDGIFWIGIQDFIQNFGQICACKYNKNYVSTSLPLTFNLEKDNEFKGIFINTKIRTEGYLTLTQQDHRKYIGTSYQYSPVRLIILKIQKATKQLTQYINDIFDCDHDATVKVQLQPGDYYVFIQMDWKCNFTRQVVLNFYGQHFIGMAEDTQIINAHNLFNEVVLLHEKFTQKQRIYKYAKDENILRITGSIAGYVYYHYSNKSTQNQYVCQNVMLMQKKFIEVYGEKQKDQFTVKVFPEEQRIVTLKVNKEGNGAYTFSTKIQFYIIQKYSIQKLRDLADKKPTKVKKRQVQGKQIDVKVKTYNYSGGVVLLYQNKMDKYAYFEQITFDLDNLELENQKMPRDNKLQIELQPQTQKLISFVVASPGKEIVFKTKISYYLNSPQFKF